MSRSVLLAHGRLVHTLAENSRRCRQERALTQQDVAEMTGMSIRHVQYIEAEAKRPTLMALAQLAIAFDVDPWDLLRPLGD